MEKVNCFNNNKKKKNNNTKMMDYNVVLVCLSF